MLADLTSSSLTADGAYRQWAVLGIILLLAAGFALMNVVFSSLIGPRRQGKIKDDPYESGVDPSGDTHRRFNVRFYLVAMIFLVFDVEVLFFIPWIVIFPKYQFLNSFLPASAPFSSMPALFAAALLFTAIVLLAYIYAWAKGIFKWD